MRSLSVSAGVCSEPGLCGLVRAGDCMISVRPANSLLASATLASAASALTSATQARMVEWMAASR